MSMTTVATRKLTIIAQDPMVKVEEKDKGKNKDKTEKS